MQLKLETLKYQDLAIQSVVKLFEGTEKNTFDNACFEGIRSNYSKLTIDEVEIFNALGQLVKTQKLTQTNNIISIDDLESGEYYLRIYNDGNFLKSDKIIKK